MCVTCQLVSCSDSLVIILFLTFLILSAVTNYLQQSTTLSNTPYASFCHSICPAGVYVHMSKVSLCVVTRHLKRPQDSSVKITSDV